MNPDEILFSTPTLNNELPAVGAAVPGPDCHQMHEDNWRQFEFVAPSCAAGVARELAAIDEIWKKHSVPLGEGGTAFRSVHVRQRIPVPLNIPMSVSDLERMFGRRASPMTFFGYEKVLSNVHAIRLENVVVYAVLGAQRMTTLGLDMHDRFAITGARRLDAARAAAADRFEQFITKHDLQLVHWPSRTLFPSPPAVMDYLRLGRA